jgi:hypothetical protein
VRLARAARHLKVRDEDWHNNALLPGAEMFLAYQLLVRPLSVEVVQTIADLARAGEMTDRRFRDLVSLIRPTWVDADAARQLITASEPAEPSAAAAAPPPAGERPDPSAWIFGINADLEGTLETYVQRAICCANYGYWPCTLSGVHGEAATEELLAQSETAIRAKLNVRSRELDKRDFAAPRVKGAFLLFDPGVANPAKLAEVARTLHSRYPRLTVLMATGRQRPPADLLAAWQLVDLRFVEPQLSDDAERDGDQLSADLAGMVGGG